MFFNQAIMQHLIMCEQTGSNDDDHDLIITFLYETAI